MSHEDANDNPWGGDWGDDQAQEPSSSAPPQQQSPQGHQPPPGQGQQSPQGHQPPPGQGQGYQQNQQYQQGQQPHHGPAPQGQAQYSQSTSPPPLAIATLVAGIAGWTIAPFFASIAAVVMAYIEWNNIKSGESPEDGKIFVIIGGGLGASSLIIYLLLGLAFFGLFFLPCFCAPFLAA